LKAYFEDQELFCEAREKDIKTCDGLSKERYISTDKHVIVHRKREKKQREREITKQKELSFCLCEYYFQLL